MRKCLSTTMCCPSGTDWGTGSLLWPMPARMSTPPLSRHRKWCRLSYWPRALDQLAHVLAEGHGHAHTLNTHTYINATTHTNTESTASHATSSGITNSILAPCFGQTHTGNYTKLKTHPVRHMHTSGSVQCWRESACFYQSGEPDMYLTIFNRRSKRALGKTKRRLHPSQASFFEFLSFFLVKTFKTFLVSESSAADQTVRSYTLWDNTCHEIPNVLFCHGLLYTLCDLWTTHTTLLAIF